MTPARDGLVLALGRAPLATRHGTFIVHRFRDCAAGAPALALVVGDVRGGEPLMARVHSSCVTSEAFGGCDCDCADQLHAALRALAAAGRGVLFYLPQEGRGAGLVAKALDRMLVQASAQRLTTFEAYARLGLSDDGRSYGAVASMARLLGIVAPLRLLSSNPEKAARLVRAGVAVDGTRPLAVPASPWSRHYLDAKARAGHAVVPPGGAGPAALPEPVPVAAPMALPGARDVVRVASYLLPVRAPGGVAWWRVSAWVDGGSGREHVVLTLGAGGGSVPVRVQREALLDRFAPLAPRFRAGWDAALARMVACGRGIVAFVREGDDVGGLAGALVAAHLGGRRGRPLVGVGEADDGAVLCQALARAGAALDPADALEAA